MGFLDFLGGLFDASIQGATTQAQIDASKEISEKNLAFQRETLDYQKALQQQIFAREDNSVQRRVADLEAAGMNKALSAGSSASAGEALGVITPQQDTSWIDKISGFTGLAGAFLDNALKTAQAREAQANADVAEHDSKIITGQNVWTSGTYSNPWLQLGGFLVDKLGLNFDFPNLDGNGTGSGDATPDGYVVSPPSASEFNWDDWFAQPTHSMADYNWMRNSTTEEERKAHGYTY